MYLCFRTVGESTDEDEDEDDEGQTEKSTMKTSVEAAGHLIIEDKLSVIDNLVMLFVSVIVGKRKNSKQPSSSDADARHKQLSAR